MCIPFPERKAGVSSQVLMVLPQGELQVLSDGDNQFADSLEKQSSYFPAHGEAR